MCACWATERNRGGYGRLGKGRRRARGRHSRLGEISPADRAQGRDALRVLQQSLRGIRSSNGGTVYVVSLQRDSKEIPLDSHPSVRVRGRIGTGSEEPVVSMTETTFRP
jgi:hypothetical protein